MQRRRWRRRLRRLPVLLAAAAAQLWPLRAHRSSLLLAVARRRALLLAPLRSMAKNLLVVVQRLLVQVAAQPAAAVLNFPRLEAEKKKAWTAPDGGCPQQTVRLSWSSAFFACDARGRTRELEAGDHNDLAGKIESMQDFLCSRAGGPVSVLWWRGCPVLPCCCTPPPLAH